MQLPEQFHYPVSSTIMSREGDTTNSRSVSPFGEIFRIGGATHSKRRYHRRSVDLSYRCPTDGKSTVADTTPHGNIAFIAARNTPRHGEISIAHARHHETTFSIILLILCDFIDIEKTD